MRPTGAQGETRVEAWVDRVGGWIERSPGLMRQLGDLESRMLRDRLSEIPVRAPIYVTGLARSGSTILLELLARHPELATHRYRDFPPVLTPVLWNRFVDRAATHEAEPRERAHRDRIAVTPESPEAFEEVVWMAFFADLHHPARNAALDAATSNPDFESFYRDHIRKILLVRGGSRYLSKANYNLTRLGYLLKLFPDARFVVPVRDPEWHIASLMKQHALFRAEGRRDPRVVRHMSRAGHFEFGLDRRPVNVGLGDETARIDRLWRGGDEIDGWARYWNMVYAHVAGRLAGNPALAAATFVVRYEDLCSGPAATLARILDHCGLPAGDLPEIARQTVSAPAYYRPAFSEPERRLIAERTRDTARLFGYADPFEAAGEPAGAEAAAGCLTRRTVS